MSRPDRSSSLVITALAFCVSGIISVELAKWPLRLMGDGNDITS